MRFYAGIPIELDQPSLQATVYVVDTRPRASLARGEERRFRDLAVVVGTILTARQRRAEAKRSP